MISFFVILSFVLGFFLGVFERKVDKLKVNKVTFTKKILPQAEILTGLDPEELLAQDEKEFYDKLR